MTIASVDWMSRNSWQSLNDESFASFGVLGAIDGSLTTLGSLVRGSLFVNGVLKGVGSLSNNGILFSNDSLFSFQ
jgi:hypothetical protein